MKKFLITICLFSTAFLSINNLFAQSPYSLSPDWYFGQGGRLTFPNGNYPTSGAPTPGSMLTNTSNGPEASTSVCQTDGSVAIYTNTLQVYNGSDNAGWFDYQIDLTSAGFQTCAGSSTGGAVSFPDPASPSNAYYLITANDLTSGACAGKGVNLHRFTGTGTNVTFNSGPTLMAASSFASEAITGCTDGNGGYWVIVHSQTASNTFRVWHFTSGGMSAPNDYTVGANVSATPNSQSYLKVSPCQDKIAYHSGGVLVVHDFNRTTGVVGSELRRLNPGTTYGVGLEFSPDGNRVFASGQGSTVVYVDIASGTTGTVAGSASWSMQLGPDGKIYTSPGGSTSTVGVISTPNTTPTYSTISLPGGATIFRGLNNIVWLSPEAPVINDVISSCSVDFSHDFENYFNTDIPVNSGTFSWNFGEPSSGASNTSTSATPNHTYAGNGTYTVTMSVNDATCGHTWSASKQVTVSCIVPPVCTYTLTADIAATPSGNITIDDVTPVTINFDGSGSIFDAVGVEPHEFAWYNGAPGPLNPPYNLTSSSTLSFQYNGGGGNLPQGHYKIYLVTKQGLCSDTTFVEFDVIHPTCTYNLQAKIDPVIATVLVDGITTTTVNFNGLNSIFDAGGSEPHQFYWLNGGVDTLTYLYSTNSSSSLTFGHNGVGGLPEGTYNVYLITRQGNLCFDTTHVTFNVAYNPCSYNLVAKIDAVNDVELDGKNVTTVNFNGTNSIFDAANVYTEKYFWSIGHPDTTSPFATTATTSLNFAFRGTGGNHPEGTYDVYLVTNEGFCLDTVKVTFDVTHFFIPNLVTPNGDNLNDLFEITNTGGRFDVVVYNRWGDKVFEEKGYTKNWDVTKESDGIYYFNVKDTKKGKSYKGWVQIVR